MIHPGDPPLATNDPEIVSAISNHLNHTLPSPYHTRIEHDGFTFNPYIVIYKTEHRYYVSGQDGNISKRINVLNLYLEGTDLHWDHDLDDNNFAIHKHFDLNHPHSIDDILTALAETLDIKFAQ